MKTAEYKLAFLAAFISFSLFSAESFAKSDVFLDKANITNTILNDVRLHDVISTDKGINFSGQKITGLTIGTEESDAVTLKQLNQTDTKATDALSVAGNAEDTAQQASRDAGTAINSANNANIVAGRAEQNANNYTDQRFGQLDNKIDRVEKRANAGIAGVTAISSIPYVAEDTFSFGMALGHYRDSQAVATGIQYKPSPNTNVRVNASWNNGGDTNVGAGFAVGW